MKLAKLLLVAVTTLSIAGGALAFKTNRILRTFYGLGPTTINGQATMGCVVPTNLNYAPNPFGVTIPYSSTFYAPTTTCVCTVIPD